MGGISVKGQKLTIGSRIKGALKSQTSVSPHHLESLHPLTVTLGAQQQARQVVVHPLPVPTIAKPKDIVGPWRAHHILAFRLLTSILEIQPHMVENLQHITQITAPSYANLKLFNARILGIPQMLEAPMYSLQVNHGALAHVASPAISGRETVNTMFHPLHQQLGATHISASQEAKC